MPDDVCMLEDVYLHDCVPKDVCMRHIFGLLSYRARGSIFCVQRFLRHAVKTENEKDVLGRHISL